MEFEPGRKFQIDWEVANTRIKSEVEMMQRAKERFRLSPTFRQGTCFWEGKRHVYWGKPLHEPEDSTTSWVTLSRGWSTTSMSLEAFNEGCTIELTPDEFRVMLEEHA